MARDVVTKWHNPEGRDLKFGKRNDITVLRSVPGGLLCQCVVVVEPGGLLVEQLPPLIPIGLFSTNRQHKPHDMHSHSTNYAHTVHLQKFPEGINTTISTDCLYTNSILYTFQHTELHAVL